ncbi:MAG: helix-turn-helix transcriptional regulator [Actinobacteria bacterium]|nr:helix-turn-helix transcriptional regulator [Actinomycetota bacterium]
MVLLRRVLGDTLRGRRLDQHRTLREVSTEAKVSLGYLSELERGQKEASSELLASICDALGVQMSDVLRDVSDTLALAEEMDGVLAPVPARSEAVGAEVAEPVSPPMGPVTNSVGLGSISATLTRPARGTGSRPRVVCAA